MVPKVGGSSPLGHPAADQVDHVQLLLDRRRWALGDAGGGQDLGDGGAIRFCRWSSQSSPRRRYDSSGRRVADTLTAALLGCVSRIASGPVGSGA